MPCVFSIHSKHGGDRRALEPQGSTGWRMCTRQAAEEGALWARKPFQKEPVWAWVRARAWSPSLSPLPLQCHLAHRCGPVPDLRVSWK